MLGKKSNPNKRPQKIDEAANFGLTFLLKSIQFDQIRQIVEFFLISYIKYLKDEYRY